MARTSTLPKRIQPMLATLTDAPFDDPGWVFEDKFDGFRMVACIEGGRVTLYSRNGKIVSHIYGEVARALERVNSDAVLDGELVALDRHGVSRFQLLQNALRHQAKLLYCANMPGEPQPDTPNHRGEPPGPDNLPVDEPPDERRRKEDDQERSDQ